MRFFRSSLRHRLENKLGRGTAHRAARRGTFHALGREQLEGRVLLTAAATITWTGGSTTSSSWSDPANWDLGRAPIDGDTLIFPAGAKQLANNDDIPGLAVNSITFQGDFATSSGYRLMGDDLTVGSGGIVDNGMFLPPPVLSPGAGAVGGDVRASAYVDLNLLLSAAQSWSVAVSTTLAIDGNVDNAGFELIATGGGTLDVEGQISGSGGLAVTEAAEMATTVELQNANTYTGPTSISFSTLIVDGSTAAASTVSVGAGATLGGVGMVDGQITFVIGGAVEIPAGTLDPGSGPDLSQEIGTLSNAGGVSFQFVPSPLSNASDAQFAMQLGGTAANPTNDRLDSAGTVSLSAATLDLTAIAGAGPFNPGQQLVIVQAGAPITTTFDGLPEGSTVSDGPQNFTISYANDRVTLTAQPLSAYLNGQAGDGTAATFVHNLYRELLGREPDAPGQAYWVSLYKQLLATGSAVPGAPTAQQTIVADFLGSTEYRQRLVEGIYTNFLHRPADAGGLTFWTAEMAAGVDEKNVLAFILGSDEFFPQPETPGVPITIDLTLQQEVQDWVGALYRDLLGRTADADGLAYWTQQTLSTGVNPAARTVIALEFLSTAETEQKLLNGNYPGAAGSVGAPGTPAEGAYALAEITGNGWDNLYFQGTLSAAEVDSLFAQLQAGQSYDQTIAGMLDMPQYFGTSSV